MGEGVEAMTSGIEAFCLQRYQIDVGFHGICDLMGGEASVGIFQQILIG